MSPNTQTTTWTTPEEAAKAIYQTIQEKELTANHAQELGQRITDLISGPELESWLDTDSPLETDDLLDVVSRLAALPSVVEVTAAMTLLIRIVPLPRLQQLWRAVTSDAAPTGRRKPRIIDVQAEEALAADDMPGEQITAEEALERAANAEQTITEADVDQLNTARQALKAESLERRYEAAQAAAEAEIEDEITGTSPDALRRVAAQAAGRRQAELAEDSDA